jgi:hypothetical protein
MVFSLWAAELEGAAHGKFSGRMLNDSMPEAPASGRSTARRGSPPDGFAYTVAIASRTP